MNRYIVLIGNRHIASCEDFAINRKKKYVRLYWDDHERYRTIDFNSTERVVVKNSDGGIVISVGSI